jgi:enamine deaminase RidA (YjgF/YER057c/UK114 family)
VAAASNDLVFVSGITARSASGDVVAEGDLEAQTRHVLDTITSILAGAGATLDDVVQVHAFVVDVAQWPRVAAVFDDYWGRSWPASTVVPVARLFDQRQLIEVDALAAVAPAVEGQ